MSRNNLQEDLPRGLIVRVALKLREENYSGLNGVRHRSKSRRVARGKVQTKSMRRKTGERAEREERKERFVGTETAKLLEKEREGVG